MVNNGKKINITTEIRQLIMKEIITPERRPTPA
jgi:hypothetical protein